MKYEWCHFSGYSMTPSSETNSDATTLSEEALETYDPALRVDCASGLMFWLSRKRFVGS